MRYLRSIGTKLAVAVALVVGLAFTLLTVTVDRVAREHLTREADGDARRLAEAIWRSTRSAMLDDRHERIRRTISFVAHQGDIEHIQLLDHRGIVVFSSEAADEGQRKAATSPECGSCHGGSRRASTPPPWTYRQIRPGGPDSLGVIRPLYNLPECQRSGCHAGAAPNRVLGMLFVSVSLARHEESVAKLRDRLFLFAGLITALATAIVFGLLIRLVGRPVSQLVEGTRRLAAGDLEHPIAVYSHDEIGELARSFNENTEKLARAQRQLVEAEKLASVGRLAAGVAHEINNPLTGILTYAEAMRDELEAAEARQRQDLESIIGETLRCREIVHRLLDFARQRPMARRAASLGDLVERVVQLVERQAPFAKVVIARRLDPGLGDVALDTNLMHQVIVNLLVNAAQAMPDGGVITVETAASTDRARALLRVSDTGPGIAPEVRSRLFEPFFTTKSQGTGLGLAVAWGIVQRHHGTLSFASEPGKGTTFTVELPRQAPPAAPAREAAVSAGG
ncbi:MAG TPA: ATP-binding protein [Polyangia bacterium]